jgi:hypothetical protein
MTQVLFGLPPVAPATFCFQVPKFLLVLGFQGLLIPKSALGTL